MIYLFWFSIIFVLYTYLGYPLLLLLLSLFYHNKNQKHLNQIGNFYPAVSLIISVYNEEEVIEDKILNSLELNYPKELLEIIVISDGSDDRTNEIVARYADKGVLLRYYEGRIGKTACLNKAIPLTKGEIIVFSDANSKYDKDAIRELVKHFSDEKIGFVTGHTKYRVERNSDKLYPIGLYSKIEKFTKKLESGLSSCIGADGAIFAIRKKLYQPLNDFDINDFVIPLNIIRQGFRGIMEEQAFCTEEAAKGNRGEFNRQARISNRTIRALFNNADMLNPFKFGIFSFELFSHKMSKFLAPFFMLTLLSVNLALINDGPLYVTSLSFQVILYLLSFLGHKSESFRDLSGLISVSRTFTMVNLAILWGWIKYFQGHTYTSWTTVR
ncbi:MAG: glycosyltransferase family 2 protein [Nitrospirota bacterium]